MKKRNEIKEQALIIYDNLLFFSLANQIPLFFRGITSAYRKRTEALFQLNKHMSNILILSQTDIDSLLSQGDPTVANEIIDLMQTTFVKFTQGHDDEEKALKAQSPQRIGVSTDSHKVLFMPSRLDTTTSIKIVSVPTKEGLSGLPATILVLDENTGCVQAVMNAGALTAVRTAAGKTMINKLGSIFSKSICQVLVWLHVYMLIPKLKTLLCSELVHKVVLMLI